MPDKQKVFFILSDTRSGSTLLDRLLSLQPGFFSVGELKSLSGHIDKIGPGEKYQWKCTCGNEIEECEFWKPVIIEIRKSFHGKLPSTFPPLIRKKELVSNLPANEYIDFYFELYNLIFKLNKEYSYLVDSSKVPKLGMLLKKKNPDKIVLIKLYRNIPATAVSKYKHYQLKSRRKLPFVRFVFGAFFLQLKILWALKFRFAKTDYINIDYDRLVLDPKKSIDRILTYSGLSKAFIPELIDFEGTHNIGGSPSRLEPKPILKDDSWRDFYKKRPIALLLGNSMDGIIRFLN